MSRITAIGITLLALWGIQLVGGVNGAVAAGDRPCSERATVTGTDGDDRLRGTKRLDVIKAGGGDDRISRVGPGDLVCAGVGADSVRGKRPPKQRQLARASAATYTQASAYGGDGDDRFALACPASGPDYVGWNIDAGPGDDYVDVTCANVDYVGGGPGNDELLLGRGHDWAFGGDGDDLIIDAYSAQDECDDDIPPLGFDPGTVPDRRCYLPCRPLSCGAWNPTATIYESWEDSLLGEDGADRVIGGNGPDAVSGTNGTENGGTDPDVLSGGPGGDALTGGPGHDLCDGGSGDTDVNGWGPPYSTGGITPDCEEHRNLEMR